MAKRLDIVAQEAMDDFYGDYKGDDQFWGIEDFISRCSDTVTDLYLQEYRTIRQELRQERRDEIIGTSADWLSVEEVEVKRDGEELVAQMKSRVMSFPFDTQQTGIQEVIQIVPRGTSLERTNITEAWQLKYTPKTDCIFWWVEKDKIMFFTKGSCNVKKVKVLYIPTGDADSELPDAVANYVRTTTVMTMKQIANGVVIDKTADDNQNKVIETEINKKSLRT